MTGSAIGRVIGGCKRPQRVVNLCFIMVFIFSTLLTWREVVILEEAYVANQRNSLDNIANSTDRHFQHSIDNLLFYRNTMRYALQSPISTDKSRRALNDFEHSRTQPFWQLRLDLNRGMPISGVSDEFVNSNKLLARDDSYIRSELMAALEFSYILQLADRTKDLQSRMFYASRSGFFITDVSPGNDPQIISIYDRLVTQRYFASQSPQDNPKRKLQWTHTYNPAHRSGQIITAAVPLDNDNYWYGVLAMDFRIASVHEFLQDALKEEGLGTLLMYDRKFNLIATSDEELPLTPLFTRIQQAQIARATEQGNSGVLRMDSRFITWAKLNSFDGVLVKVHSLEESITGAFGRISIMLSILWVLFSGMLLLSWLTIRRLVTNMLTLQSTLTWRANYDTLTRIYNRGAFFDIAREACTNSRLKNQPVSVIQLDLDFFKSINDRFGHHVGDKVLIQAASVFSRALHENHVPGRVGGEEFCVVLPGATLKEAVTVAERIRERINAKTILLRQGQILNISASLGVVCSEEKDDYDFERLQSCADHRLYKAKQAGRNRVCASD